MVLLRFLLFALLSSYGTAQAQPWFTGPILAPGGITIPNGHTNFEMYTLYTLDTGFYSDRNRWVHDLTDNSKVLNPVFSHGTSENTDVQFSLPYLFNRKQGTENKDLGDPAITLGYQVLRQKQSKWRPNLRLTMQQIIPMGEYNSLDPALNGTDATGLGSYQTLFSFNFQHLAKLSEVHYLRSRLALTYGLASSVRLHGISVYGGTKHTQGKIKPGSLLAMDIAGELTMTQNVVLVMEAYLSHRPATRFKGFIGDNPDGTPGTIGRQSLALDTLAPAIEYNFTPNIGLLMGTWFTLQGRNSAHFNTYVAALNIFW